MPPPPDRKRLETALRNADAAGDVEAARTLANEIRKLGPSEQPPPANFAFRERFARTLANNLMAVPDVSGEIVANSIAAGRAGFIRHLMGDKTPSPTFGERYAEAKEKEGMLPALFRSIPRASTEKIDAAVQSIPSLMPGGESPGVAYERNLFENMGEASAMRQAHPTASAAGDIGGDVASLFIGRRGTGVDKMLQRVESRLSGRTSAVVAETLAEDLGKVVKSPAWQKMARGSVRTLEAGVEAAALDVLKDPNATPLETAAIAAGGQLVGSGTLQAASGLLSGNLPTVGLKISVAAVAAMGLIQAFKSAAPGGRDRILDSAESGFDKVMLMLGLGIGSAALGATRYGRGNTNFADQTRTMLDGISTVHRGSTLSILSDWTEGGAEKRATIEGVLVAMAKDPTYSGKSEAERELVQKIRAGSGLVRYKTGGEF
jgi:hypothetical protein